MEPPEDKLVGTVLDGKFEILNLIGQGASSLVYRARHRLLDAFVAVKVFDKTEFQDETALLRFMNEAQILSGFDHENIVKLLAFGKVSDGRPFMVMEFLEGKTLAQLLFEETAFTQTRALPLFKQLASALKYAHEQGVIHRDLKPANVFISKIGEGELLRLLDFGISRRLRSSDPGLTQTGVLIGSANYMSPEQCKALPCDQRSDLYAFACLAYEVLCAKPPMADLNDLLIMSNQLNKSIKSVPTLYPSSTHLQSIILRCLEKEPEARYASAEELLSALELCEQLPAERTAILRQAKFFWTSALVLLLILLSAALYSYFKPESERLSANQNNSLKFPERIDGKESLETAEAKLMAQCDNEHVKVQELANLLAKCLEFRRAQKLPLKSPGFERLKERLLVHGNKIGKSEEAVKNRILLARIYVLQDKAAEGMRLLTELMTLNSKAAPRCNKLIFSMIESEKGSKSALELLEQLKSNYENRLGEGEIDWLRYSLGLAECELARAETKEASKQLLRALPRFKKYAGSEGKIDTGLLLDYVTALRDADLTEEYLQMTEPFVALLLNGDGKPNYDALSICFSRAKFDLAIGKLDDAKTICRRILSLAIRTNDFTNISDEALKSLLIVEDLQKTSTKSRMVLLSDYLGRLRSGETRRYLRAAKLYADMIDSRPMPDLIIPYWTYLDRELGRFSGSEEKYYIELRAHELSRINLFIEDHFRCIKKTEAIRAELFKILQPGILSPDESLEIYNKVAYTDLLAGKTKEAADTLLRAKSFERDASAPFIFERDFYDCLLLWVTGYQRQCIQKMDHLFHSLKGKDVSAYGSYFNCARELAMRHRKLSELSAARNVLEEALCADFKNPLSKNRERSLTLQTLEIICKEQNDQKRLVELADELKVLQGLIEKQNMQVFQSLKPRT
ncbi:MAG: serine/threonine protein kinase [Candidatus Obscuribacterales bacterium]|nr:serine/threonine protein kinase [Candidatus Obscuribacterales bacterium]